MYFEILGQKRPRSVFDCPLYKTGSFLTRDKDSLIIKIKLLDENRHKVMAKQLLLLHNGVSSYFAGNQQALEGSIQQFNIQQKKSFLEQ